MKSPLLKPVDLPFDPARKVSSHYRPLVFRRAPAQRLPAFDYLRAFVIGLVVWHHAMMAYCADGHLAHGGAYLQSSAPIVDAARWSGFNLLVVLNDSFFMPLMFLLSGLFVRASLARKGVGPYLAERARRLGVPLVVGILTVIPLAYYAAYLESGGGADLADFWKGMIFKGPWPSGPMWFVGVLLVFDVGAALILTAIEARRPPQIARVSAVKGFLVFLALSALAFLPLRDWLGPSDWLTLGPLGVQAGRIGLYALYFAAGVTIGADRLASALEKRWLRWPALMAVVMALFIAFHGDDTSGVLLTLYAAAMAVGLLAIALRFGRHRSKLGHELGANAYGIYLLHYPIVLWLQYALLKAPLGALPKALLVLVLGFELSWLASRTLRRVPGVARYV